MFCDYVHVFFFGEYVIMFMLVKKPASRFYQKKKKGSTACPLAIAQTKLGSQTIGLLGCINSYIEKNV